MQAHSAFLGVSNVAHDAHEPRKHWHISSEYSETLYERVDTGCVADHMYYTCAHVYVCVGLFDLSINL